MFIIRLDWIVVAELVRCHWNMANSPNTFGVELKIRLNSSQNLLTNEKLTIFDTTTIILTSNLCGVCERKWKGVLRALNLAGWPKEKCAKVQNKPSSQQN